jgi:hypothetical protein
MLMIKFGNTLLYQIYLTKAGYFHRISEPWHWFQVGYIRPRTNISDVSDISGIRSGSRALARAPGWIYLT